MQTQCQVQNPAQLWSGASNLTPVRQLFEEERAMLWTIFAILLVLWLLGFGFNVAGGLIHLLLVIAVVVLLINLLSGKSAAV